LRDSAIKYIGILKFILIIGIMIIFTGLAYFLGILEIDFEYSLLGTPVNSLYGITYLTLFALGFYLVILAILLILPTFDKINRKKLKNYQRLFISFGIFGTVLILYSLLIYLGILPTLQSYQTWFDYFIIGIMISFSSYLAFIFFTENFQELSVYNWIWALLVSAGFVIEILSLLTYWSLLQIIGISANYWSDLYLFGIVFLFIGGLPLLVSYKQTNKRVSSGLVILSLILIISGIITYIAPTLAINGLLFPFSIFKYNKYFDFLLFGSLLMILGVSIASNLEITQKFLKKLPLLWFFFLILGFLQYLISILMEITDTHFIDLGLDFLFLRNAQGSLLFGMTWNVFLINSFITTLSVLIIVSSLIFKESDLAIEIDDPEEK